MSDKTPRGKIESVSLRDLDPNPICITNRTITPKQAKKNIIPKMASIDAYKLWLKYEGLDEKEYQADGVSWMLERETSEPAYAGMKRGGFLCDEMGLGKTIQMLGLMLCNPKNHTLIVLPNALVSQWVSVFEKLYHIKPLVYHGPNARRISVETLRSCSIVVTTYGMIAPRTYKKQTIQPKLAEISWDRVVFDEAHHIRNRKTGKHIGACALRSEIMWMVTGTPIQNYLRDFISLCNVLCVPPKTPHQDIVGRIYLKRTKTSVGLEMPPITDTNIVVPWTNPAERSLAENVHSLISFTKPTSSNINTLIRLLGNTPLTVLMRMRQVCIMPDLIRHKVSEFFDEFEDGDERIQWIIDGLSATTKLKTVSDFIIQRKDNHRAKIVFCHFRREIDYLIHAFTTAGMTTAFIDGRTKLRERNRIMTSTDTDVVILQIRTSSEGLNLQQFKEVYFTSPHWNPYIEDQAVARSHRYGQTDEVNVFRFEMERFHPATDSQSTMGITLDGYCKIVQSTKRRLTSDIFDQYTK